MVMWEASEQPVKLRKIKSIVQEECWKQCKIDESRIAFSTGDSICIYDVISLRPKRFLIGHKNDIKDMKYISKTNTLLTSSDDCTCKLWNLYNGKCIQNFQDSRYLSDMLMLSENYFLCGGKIWEIKTGKIKKELAQEFRSMMVSTLGRNRVVLLKDVKTLAIWKF